MFNSIDWNAVGAIGQWVGALATAAAVWVSLYIARKSSSPDIRVSVGYYIPLTHNGAGKTVIMMKAVNSGTVPVNLVSSGFQLPRTNQGLWPDSAGTLPKLLKPGDSVQFPVQPEELARALTTKGYVGKIRLRPSFSDVLGRKYSTKWKFDVSSWSKGT